MWVERPTFFIDTVKILYYKTGVTYTKKGIVVMNLVYVNEMFPRITYLNLTGFNVIIKREFIFNNENRNGMILMNHGFISFRASQNEKSWINSNNTIKEHEVNLPDGVIPVRNRLESFLDTFDIGEEFCVKFDSIDKDNYDIIIVGGNIVPFVIDRDKDKNLYFPNPVTENINVLENNIYTDCLVKVS